MSKTQSNQILLPDTKNQTTSSFGIQETFEFYCFLYDYISVLISEILNWFVNPSVYQCDDPVGRNSIGSLYSSLCSKKTTHTNRVSIAMSYFFLNSISISTGLNEMHCYRVDICPPVCGSSDFRLAPDGYEFHSSILFYWFPATIQLLAEEHSAIDASSSTRGKRIKTRYPDVDRLFQLPRSEKRAQ